MGALTIYQDSYINATILSNRFIDYYMTDANDAQLKVYLYLVRMMNAHLETSVGDIADRFNFTEKDVLRALKYWKDKEILDLDLDENGTLTGIHLKNLCQLEKMEPTVESTHMPQKAAVPQNAPASGTDPSQDGSLVQGVIPIKPSYSSTQIKAFKSSHENPESGIDILYLAEVYRKKPLSQSDVNTIIYICEELGFSDEMFDHLLQYCTERNKSDFRYIEKVAISWKEAGVTTPEEADNLPGKYDRKVYEIMRQLGKTGNTPTKTEVSYINRWVCEYGFADDIILEACERTVLATEKNRFQYADSILKNWKEKGVGKISDVQDLDRQHEKKSSAKTSQGDRSAAGVNSSNGFNRFSQRGDIDFAELEKKIVKN
ncbi:MAG: DnaD domain protein [Lachnospiraceae bacterium]|nr:DnaD domain protein [Lachnospiraceae bacterium]